MMRKLAISVVATVLAGCAPTPIKPPDVGFLTFTAAQVAAIRSAEIGRFIARCDRMKLSWGARCSLKGGEGIMGCGASSSSWISQIEDAKKEQELLKEQCETFDADWADPCPALQRLATKGGKASYFSREYLTKECKERQKSAT